MGVGPIELISNPSACVNGVIICLVGNLNQVALQWFILHPSQVPHYSCFGLLSVISPKRVPKILLRACATWRSGLDAGDFNIFSNCSFFFSFFSRCFWITFSFCKSCQFFFVLL